VGFSQSLVSVGTAKCSPSGGIPGPLLGRRWLEHRCPGGLRERLIKYQGACVQGRMVNQRLSRREELGSAYTALKVSLFKGCVCPKDRGRIQTRQMWKVT